jgi:hypothetical protein
MGGSDASATHQQHGQLARTGLRGAGGGVGQQRPQLVDDEMRQHAFRPRDLQRRPAQCAPRQCWTPSRAAGALRGAVRAGRHGLSLSVRAAMAALGARLQAGGLTRCSAA